MKEYIKLFEGLSSADGYVIEDIPFTSTVKPVGGGVNNVNLRCNEPDKKIKVSGDTIEIVDDTTILYLNDGSTVELTGDAITSAMTSSYTSTLVCAKIGKSVTSIGFGAFRNCTSLSSITIPDSVTSIGGSAFFSCSELTSIVIPDSVTTIGNQAFNSCSMLTSVTIGSGVTSIGLDVFKNCISLPVVDNIRYTDNNYTCLVEALDKTQSAYTIQSGTKFILGSAFYNFTGLTSVVIPNSVTSIGNRAFYNCSGLTSITIPSSVTKIELNTFVGCTSLSSVTIGSGVTSIGESAFYKCYSLNTITYEGTISQWGQITKGSNWKLNVPTRVVHCSDGDTSI